MSHSLLSTLQKPFKNVWGLWLLLLCLSLNSGNTLAQIMPPPFNVRVTPTGPLSICSGTNQTLTATAVYPAFNVGTGFNGPVSAIISVDFLEGKVLVAGGFTRYNGTPCIRIARLNTDGSLDTSFNPGASADGDIYAMVKQPDGKIIIGGNFTTYDNTSRRGIARLNPDGSLDTSFNSGGGGFTSLVSTDTGVRCLALQSNNYVVVGGSFSSYKGTQRPTIARLTNTGTLDSFVTGPGFTDNSGNPVAVSAVAVQANGSILASGSFSRLTTTSTTTVNGLVRLTSSGALDPSITGTGFNGPIFSFALQSDQSILVGGSFASFNGTPRNGIARLTSFGGLDTGFTPDPIFSGSTVRYLALDLGGSRALVVGSFANGFVRLNPSGSVDNTFTPSTNFNNTTISTLEVQQNDSRVLVGGSFARRIARLNTNGTVNNTDTPANAAPVNYTWRTGTTTVSNTNSVTVSANGSYAVTATSYSRSVTPPAVSVTVIPGPSVPNFPSTATPAGTEVTLTGTDFNSIQRVYFTSEPAVGQPAPGRCVGTFVVVSPTQLRVTVPDSAITGPLTFTTLCGLIPSASSFRVLPTIRNFSPQSVAAGATATITVFGTGFTRPSTTTTVSLNGVNLSNVNVISPTQLTAQLPQPPATAATGPLRVTTTTGGVGNPSANNFVVVSVATGHIDINTTRTLTDTSYPGGNSDVIVRPGVVLTVKGFLAIGGRLIIQDGATLVTGTSWAMGASPGPDAGMVVGGGSLVLAAGATLVIRDPAGISSGSGPSGAIQLITSRSFSPDANYIYRGTTAQMTGTGLPSRVRTLEVSLSPRTPSNRLALTLTNPTSVAQKLTMGDSSTFVTGSNLTLLSDATGTALVENIGTSTSTGIGTVGVVQGAVTVQRYINPATNNANGLRYYGSPVVGAAASVLAAAGQAALVYDYDQSRPATQRDTVPLITYGFAPLAAPTTTTLTPGRGYAAVIRAATTVAFTGTLNNGTLTQTLPNNSTEYYAGWHLVSNPYPAPISWDLVAPADRANLEAAIYLYESTGPGQGYYRSYVNGAGTASPLIAAGQAFFVRVKRGQSSGTLTFRNAQRLTDYAQQAPFNRPTLALDELELVCSNGPGGGSHCNSRGCRDITATTATTTEPKVNYSRVTLYRATTTPPSAVWFNPEVDAQAEALQSRSNVALSITDGQEEALAVKQYAAFTAATIIPLTLNATAPAPDYVLGLNQAKLLAFTTRLTPFLHDKVANKWKSLRDSVYTFPLTAAEVLNPIVGRFELHFRQVLAVSPAARWSEAGTVAVYPNPARQQAQVWVPAVAGEAQVRATLRNSLGQLVRQQDAALPAAGTTLHLDLKNLAGGVYILRVQAGPATATRRLLVE